MQHVGPSVFDIHQWGLACPSQPTITAAGSIGGKPMATSGNCVSGLRETLEIPGKVSVVDKP